MNEGDPNEKGPWPAVESLIPHRPPMLFVQKIVEVRKDGVVCLGRFSADSCFAAQGNVPGLLGLELAAQAAALYGALKRRETGGEPEIGYLVTISATRFAVPVLPVKQPLLATIQERGSAGSLTMFDGVVTGPDGTELVVATMSTYLTGARNRSSR